MLRLKNLNRGLSNFLIVGLLISSPGNAAQTGTGNVRGSHDSSGQNSGGASFLPDDVTNDVPLPHYCTTTGTNNSQGTWLDNGGACCGTTGGAQDGGCASCSGADSINNGTWVISGSSTGWSTVNNTSVTDGGVCCGTGANATNAACLPYCSVGPDGLTGTGINTQTGASCCGSQSFLVPAPGGTAVAGACANDVSCLGSVQAQGLSGTWASGPNVGQTCCGSGTVLSGGANNGACPQVCSGTATTSGTWSASPTPTYPNNGACCGSGTAAQGATNGACIPTCNGTATTTGAWSDGSGACCGTGTTAQGATSGACPGGPVASCTSTTPTITGFLVNGPSAGQPCCNGSLTVGACTQPGGGPPPNNCYGGAITTMTNSSIVINGGAATGHQAVRASCNPGQYLIGGGCHDNGDYIDGNSCASGGNTALVFSYPDSSNSWFCDSRDIIVPQSRTLTAYAICSTSPTASNISVTTGSATKAGHFAVAASCAPGLNIVSGGCHDGGDYINGGAGNTAMVFGYPNSNSSWYCDSRDILIGENRTLTAYAVCAPVTSCATAIATNSAISISGGCDTGHQAVKATCPAGGIVTGGGCHDNGDFVDGNSGNTGLVFSYPDTVSSWYCDSRDIITPESRTLTAYAICTLPSSVP